MRIAMPKFLKQNHKRKLINKLKCTSSSLVLVDGPFNEKLANAKKWFFISQLEGSFIAQKAPATMQHWFMKLTFPLHDFALWHISLWYFTDDIKIGNDHKRKGNANGKVVERVPERSEFVFEVHWRVPRWVHRSEESWCWRHSKHSRSL